MPLSDIVNVQISRETAAVSQAGFGTALFVAPHKSFNDRLQYYSSQSAVEAVFAATSKIALATAALFGQNPSPTRVAIGRRTVDNVELTVASAVSGATYTVTINGTDFSTVAGGGDTVETIADALVAAINLGSEPVTATDGVGGVFDLDADVAGVAYTVEVTDNITITDYVATDAIGDDLTAIEQENNDWYGLAIQDRTQATVEAATTWVEARRKLFLTASYDANIVDQSVSTDTTSIAAYVRTNSLARTGVIYHADAATEYIEMGLFGQILPLDPGSYTAMFKTLATIAVDTLTDTQATNALAKNCNIYQEIGGVNITREGKVGEGEYIDIIVFVDWLQARMAERIFSKLVNLPKVPFTDGGVALIEGEIRAQLDQGIARGGLAKDPAYTVTVPKVADISAQDKANRLLANIVFAATLAGAIHAVEIQGTVTV